MPQHGGGFRLPGAAETEILLGFQIGCVPVVLRSSEEEIFLIGELDILFLHQVNHKSGQQEAHQQEEVVDGAGDFHFPAMQCCADTPLGDLFGT